MNPVGVPLWWVLSRVAYACFECRIGRTGARLRPISDDCRTFAAPVSIPRRWRDRPHHRLLRLHDFDGLCAAPAAYAARLARACDARDLAAQSRAHLR